MQTFTIMFSSKVIKTLQYHLGIKEKQYKKYYKRRSALALGLGFRVYSPT